MFAVATGLVYLLMTIFLTSGNIAFASFALAYSL